MTNFLNYDDAIEQMRTKLEKAISMTTAQINREYKIKIYGRGVNKLVGVYGLLEYVGDERAAKMLRRANKCLGDVCKCQVYGQGLQVSFYLN